VKFICVFGSVLRLCGIVNVFVLRREKKKKIKENKNLLAITFSMRMLVD
jgi:hypothetical protein